MSLLRSPTSSEPRSSSQPDLSKITVEPPMSTITTRKRKQPDQCSCNQEVSEMRNELSRMTALLEKFVTSQQQNMDTMRENISEINLELKCIKESNSTLMKEHYDIKTSVTELNLKINNQDEKITCLENDLSVLKIGSSSLPEQTLLANEQTIRELRERINREKNIIITELSEHHTNSKSSDENEITTLLSNITENCPKPLKMFRIGKLVPGRNRKLKVCFKEQQTAKTILRNKEKIPKELKIYSDRTPSQIKYFNEVKNAMEVRIKNGEKDLTIKFIKGVPTIINNIPKNYNLSQ